MNSAISYDFHFCGTPVGTGDLDLIRSVITSCSGLSRTELANTVCEILEWRRRNGNLKTVECRSFLEELDEYGVIQLPKIRPGRPRGSKTSTSAPLEPVRVIHGKRGEFGRIEIVPVTTREENASWRAMVEAHHYLGHRVPFGAHIRYFIRLHYPEPAIVGALQFSSPAWRMEARDSYLGWDGAARRTNLQKVVSNSRFLILPSVRIKNLASSVLSLAAARLPSDWEERFAVRPLLLETLVDQQKYSGTCYRAANWVEVGRTTGRGRNDRGHRRHGESPKTVFLYPLEKHALRCLREDCSAAPGAAAY